MSSLPHLARDLSAIVGERHIRQARAERLTYAMDGLPTHRRVPDLVVLPGSREELIAVVRLLAALGVPFVPRGAGTGLSGGALADEGTVLLVLTRLNRILRIDRDNRLAIVEPGVVNAKLGAAAKPHGLQYAPYPSSQSACTIGGNVAENAGGPHCLKYGVTANHVLALEVLLADGTVVESGSPGGEPWGPDLVGLFVGSEGNFGIATKITVRLTPLPRAVRTMLADFNGLRTAGEAVSAIIAAGIVPAALEMMDQSCIAAVEDSVYAAGYPRDAAAVLLVELDGCREEAVAADADTIADILRAHGARSVRAEDVRDRVRVRRHGFLAAAVELDQQHRGGITWVARRVHRIFHGIDARLVHHLQSRGHDAARDHGGHGLARRAQCVEVGEQRADGTRHGQQAHPDAGRDSEVALRADEQPHQIGAPRLAARAAELDDLPVGQHDLQSEHVGRRHPVLETVRPTR